MPTSQRAEDKNRARGYKGKDPLAIQRRLNRRAYGGDHYIPDHIGEFRPKDGRNLIRFLHRGDGSGHYGVDVWCHNFVGPDKGSYLCLEKMRHEACPLCEEWDKIRRQMDENDPEYKERRKELRPCEQGGRLPYRPRLVRGWAKALAPTLFDC